jgi:hypothetical protein
VRWQCFSVALVCGFPDFAAAVWGIEAGIDWPLHRWSTPELDQLQAHLLALVPYRAAVDVLKQMFALDAGKDPETLRRHTVKTGEVLRNDAGASLEMRHRWLLPLK